MSDIFREVDEDIRSDRLTEFWSKYSIVVLGLAVAIVIATAIFTWLAHQRLAQAEGAGAAYEAAQALSASQQHEAAAAAFADLAKTAPKGYQLLARMRAAEEMSLSDPSAAVTALDLLAVDPAVDLLWRDLARLRAGMLRVDSADKSEVEQRFAPLLNGSYRFTAREFMGLSALKRGDFEEAGKLFDQIVVDPNAPADLRQRVQGFLSLVRGGGKFTPESPAAPVTK
jgi:hypothetical protein